MGSSSDQFKKPKYCPSSKHLDKFYIRKDIPWVNLIWDTYYLIGEIPHVAGPKGFFWWKDILKLYETFSGIAICKVQRASFGGIAIC
jgi:hypothetical protein